jgi:acetolactate synthase-1/2/3 large subunit
VKYAESYGAKGYRCESAASLPDLLARCLSEPGVNLIEVPVDYSDNDPILNKEIKTLSAAV